MPHARNPVAASNTQERFCGDTKKLLPAQHALHVMCANPNIISH
jgi:hypothetical protein